MRAASARSIAIVAPADAGDEAREHLLDRAGEAHGELHVLAFAVGLEHGAGAERVVHHSPAHRAPCAGAAPADRNRDADAAGLVRCVSAFAHLVAGMPEAARSRRRPRATVLPAAGVLALEQGVGDLA